ncbi:hypothetical protein BU24DRAFT_469093 [Aaosphaeria arxii CBS 175.79]|uniref:Uncharacterized protein n=1 Tax=Aaosphaeria arxii CBS 175.79 TaxID=1450172 RepID=A0A6A5X5Q4_9PLEO|nr:uncharacterized protein BU24DRAFT_469093 [Aaosphaeria arxii CBS 175.79]KAF2008279.1 hypothetical protein BU24DRAFT_469093 [Aaosphaeria arxii CBS 175.79]
MADAIARGGHTTAPAGDETCPEAVSISTMLAMIKKIREVEAFISTLDGQPSYRAAVNVYYKSALHLTGKRKAALSPDDRNYMAALLH